MQTFAGTKSHGWFIEQAASQLVVDETDRFTTVEQYLVIPAGVSTSHVAHDVI